MMITDGDGKEFPAYSQQSTAANLPCSLRLRVPRKSRSHGRFAAVNSCLHAGNLSCTKVACTAVRPSYPCFQESEEFARQLSCGTDDYGKGVSVWIFECIRDVYE